MDQREWNLQNQNGSRKDPEQTENVNPTDQEESVPKAAVFSGSGEAPVDYNVAKGASVRVDETGQNNSFVNEPEKEEGTYYYSDGYAAGSQTEEETASEGYYTDQGTAETYYNGEAYDSSSQYQNYQNGPQYGGYTAGPQTENPFVKPKKKKKMTDKAKRILASALVIVLCGVAGFGGATIANKSGGTKTSSTKSNVNITGDVTSVDAASAIAEKVMPSVVGISTISQSQSQTIFGIQSGTVEGIGTGIIVSEDGYVLTNSHVVNDGDTEEITVDLYDGTECSGTVLWNDSSLDLAIVKIEADNLTAAELGDSDDVNIGDYALAIGNPLGLNYERSVTSGIISGLNRSITTQDETTGSTNNMDGLIQTDAAINSGNSGGPLINSEGKVIGINTAKASSSEGLGFAIPINTATPIIKQIKEKGSYEQTYVGIAGADLSTITENYTTDFKADSGVYVMQIYTDSPAASAGLKEGDIITEIDGKAIDGMSALKSALINYSPGDEVELTIERDKSSQKIKLTLGSSSDAGSALQSNDGSSQQGSSGSSGSGSYGNSGSGSYGSGGSGIYGGSGSSGSGSYGNSYSDSGLGNLFG